MKQTTQIKCIWNNSW